MRSRGESWDADEFALNMHRCMDANRVVMFHYREKVVETLLNAGIRVDVFGETWNNCPLRDNPLLVIHGDVGYMEGIGILAASRISLNVMSWHKAGMTERIANSMLNYALCLTDTTDYLEKHFTDGEDIVLFRLDRLGELPDKVRGLLGDAALVDRITENAYANASANHRWCNRARDFVAMLEMGAFEE
jgi:UDP-2,3-diacylglucosamine pyrophosphatase LpxH